MVRFLTDEEEMRLRAQLEERDRSRQKARSNADQWRRARKYVERGPRGIYTDHLTPIVLLALNTGLRRGELLGLSWRDVSLGLRTLTVHRAGAKSGQTRHVPLNSEAVRVLELWRPNDVEESAFVFPGASPSERLVDIKNAWLAVAKRAKLNAFRFHDLRHTFASRLVMAGVDLNTVRELLGHSELSMTLRYAHLAPPHKADAVERIVRR